MRWNNFGKTVSDTWSLRHEDKREYSWSVFILFVGALDITSSIPFVGRIIFW